MATGIACTLVTLILLSLATGFYFSSPITNSEKSQQKNPRLVAQQPTLPAGFNDTVLASLDHQTPTDIAWTPDGRLLLSIQAGKLFVYENGVLENNPALDLSGSTCSLAEMGLLSVTVHPDFSSNHFVYIYYTHQGTQPCVQGNTNNAVNRVSRFSLSDGNIVDQASELVLLQTQPLITGDHNAGDLKFGKDDLLYVSVGNGGGPGFFTSNSQNLGTLQGKIVRITDTGGIPDGNPFTGAGTARCNLAGVPPSGSASGTKCEEVFALGLRNPFRFAFDPNSQETVFYINDVGENMWEEIDLGQTGANYGWPTREGPCATGSVTDCGLSPPGLTDPIAWYAHNITINGYLCRAITGGAFVPRGVWPGLSNGTYLFADWGCGQVWTLTRNGQGAYGIESFASLDAGPVSLRFGPFGSSQALYYVTQANGGQLRRIALVDTRADFSLSAYPSSVNVIQGSFGTSTVTVMRVNSFMPTINVTLIQSSNNLDCNLTATSLPASGSDTSTLSCTGPPGSYTVKISADASHEAIVTVTVMPQGSPDFAVTHSGAMRFESGSTGRTSIHVTGQNGFNSMVNLTITNTPLGLVCSLDKSSISSSTAATLSCRGQPGSYSVTVIGTSGSTSHSTPVSVQVDASMVSKTPPDNKQAPLFLYAGVGIGLITIIGLIVFTLLRRTLHARKTNANP